MPEKVARVVRKRSRGRHVWIFSNEVIGTEGEPVAGDLVKVYERDRFIGSGMYNPNSLIRIRIYSNLDEELDRAFFSRRFTVALALRRVSLPREDDYRLVYGESDGVPGLVVDRYGRHFVLQAYTAAVDQRLDDVAAALGDVLDVASVFEKDDFRLRDREGLERRERLLQGTLESDIIVSENGARFVVDIGTGQKSGYYFDQRLTRRKVRAFSDARRVLDVFSYTGSFSVNAALGGATSVLGVDSSSDAVRLAAVNARLNGVGDRCRFVVADAFEFLQTLLRRGERFDLVNLDPPAFIKTQREKGAGIKGYRRLNGLAMRLLEPGGVLVSSSCSHYLFWQDLHEMLASAAQVVGRDFTVLDRTMQGPDHPVLLSMPETEYLRGLVLRFG